MPGVTINSRRLHPVQAVRGVLDGEEDHVGCGRRLGGMNRIGWNVDHRARPWPRPPGRRSSPARCPRGRRSIARSGCECGSAPVPAGMRMSADDHAVAFDAAAFDARIVRTALDLVHLGEVEVEQVFAGTGALGARRPRDGCSVRHRIPPLAKSAPPAGRMVVEAPAAAPVPARRRRVIIANPGNDAELTACAAIVSVHHFRHAGAKMVRPLRRSAVPMIVRRLPAAARYSLPTLGGARRVRAADREPPAAADPSFYRSMAAARRRGSTRRRQPAMISGLPPQQRPV